MKLDMFLFYFSGIVSLTHSILQPPHEFYLIRGTLSWPDAQNYCRMRYTDLATVKNNSLLLKLTEMATSSGVTGPIWIGLYNDINSWRWSYKKRFLDRHSEVNWKPGQPNNNHGNESCVGIGETGDWSDFNCALLRPFICFRDVYAILASFSKFIAVNSPRNWTDAQTYCRKFHTDLASSRSEMDIDMLGQIASDQGTSWFGLYRDTWKWLDGKVATNIQWSPGQPDNFNLQENCGMLQNGLLSDENCDYAHFFFCEYIPPVRRQTIKLQVMSDGNVSDPAVQSSILDLIKQKLEQHGMLNNSTVTWRVQPDGNIFYKKNIK